VYEWPQDGRSRPHRVTELEPKRGDQIDILNCRSRQGATLHKGFCFGTESSCRLGLLSTNNVHDKDSQTISCGRTAFRGRMVSRLYGGRKDC
jgi:hypothetical protein